MFAQAHIFKTTLLHPEFVPMGRGTKTGKSGKSGWEQWKHKQRSVKEKHLQDEVTQKFIQETATLQGEVQKLKESCQKLQHCNAEMQGINKGQACLIRDLLANRQ